MTYRVTFSTKSSNQNFMVFLRGVEAAITGHTHTHCDLLAILDDLLQTNFPTVEFVRLTSTSPFPSTVSLHKKHLKKDWP